MTTVALATGCLGPGAVRSAASAEAPAAGEAVADRPGGSGPSALDTLLLDPALRLDLLERAVMERNPSLAAGRAAFEESKARAGRVGALMNPMIEGMVAPRALGNEQIEAPGYVVDFSMDFPLFGQRGGEKKAARAEARAIGQEFRGTRLDLLQETRRLYYQYFLVERGIEVSEELKGLLGQFRAVALQKYAAGIVGQQDALQADVELAMLDHQGIVLRRDRRIVRARVNALLHRSAEEPLPSPVDSLPEPRVGEESSGGPDAALTRPDVLRAEAERDAWAAEASLAGKRRLPQFRVLARYDAMWAEHEMRPMVGAGLTLPLFPGSVGVGEREANAAYRKKEQERLAAIDRARSEIEEARARVEETRHEIHVIETGVLPATERALASIRAGYAANRSDFLALLNAERDLARARLDGHRARADYRMALADYERAIARGGAPIEEETP
jgi:outer membrane protein TolC